MSVVGIDLGTTNTVVGCVRSGKVHVLADERGSRLLPSVVSFHPNGEVLVGAAAKARRIIDPKNTVYSHKRLIGRSWGSPEIIQAKQRYAFELREGPGQGPLVHARSQDYTLPEISAFVLKRAKQIAETALGAPVERAVITVPAHFNELQRASTKVAGRVSGLEVLRILNEPTAAALAYGLGRSGNERVAVYDFGGGTFDCTLLDLNGNVFEVLASAGDSFLGGDDVDNLIAERMAETYLKQYRQDPRTDPQMFEKLKTTAEDIKMALSTAESHTVQVKELGFGAGGAAIHFTFTLSRRELDAMITPLVDRTFKVTQDALSLARLTPTSFDKVILVGGSTRMPLVRKRVEAFFGAPPMDRVNPDEVVAIGAAIQAAALTETTKRRSIPAAPPLPAAPGPGPAGRPDSTLTTELDSAKLKPAFASEPPGFGFAAGSTPPMTKAGPPVAPPIGAPQAGAAGATGARHRAAEHASGRRITDQGVAPATLPFPDPVLGSSSVPTARAATTAIGFGAIDDTPSLYSTPSASLPSFPSLTSPQGGAPSPIGEPEPFHPGPPDGEAFGDIHDLSLVSTTGISPGNAPTMPSAPRAPLPTGPFGAVKDLSLISTTGVSAPPVTQVTPGLPGAGDADAFGRVSDLSLISTSTSTGALDPITQARQKALQQGAFDDSAETAAMRRAPATLGLSARSEAEDADLPAVVPTADLPAAKPKRPEIRKGPQAGASMAGKPPPAASPQPFGPMEKIRGDAGPARPTPSAPQAGPMPARHAPPAETAPLAPPVPPPQAYPTAPSQVRQGFGGTLPLDQRSAPPPAFAAPVPHTAPMQPPVRHAPMPSAPPLELQSTRPMAGAAMPHTAPMGPSGVSPSQPPIFGAFASAPPGAVDAFGAPSGAFDPGVPMPGMQVAASPPMGGFTAPVLVDVSPRALVVETAGGYTDTIIPRNSKIPCERTRRFATGRDMQTTVRVRVAQGEDATFQSNTFLGEVELSGLRPAPRGEVVVAVTFEVDADGTLRVRARDVQTGQEARALLQLVGVADESSVVMMINRFAQQPVSGGG